MPIKKMFDLVAQLILIIILNFKNQGHLNVLANLNYIKPEPCNRLVSPAGLGSGALPIAQKENTAIYEYKYTTVVY